MPANTYNLWVKDAIGCEIASPPFVIKNIAENLPAPLYNDIIIPRNSTATLTPLSPGTSNYIMYNNAAGTQEIARNENGIFITAPVAADTYFYIRKQTGSCSSGLTRVKVTAVDKSEFAIAGGFTPNNDGKNDLLKVNVLGYIDIEYFRIFNRNGEEVFFTKTINDGWDGRLRGSEQDAGAYVWMAKGKDITGRVIQAKGSFVLIR